MWEGGERNFFFWISDRQNYLLREFTAKNSVSRGDGMSVQFNTIINVVWRTKRVSVPWMALHVYLVLPFVLNLDSYLFDNLPISSCNLFEGQEVEFINGAIHSAAYHYFRGRRCCGDHILDE